MNCYFHACGQKMLLRILQRTISFIFPPAGLVWFFFYKKDKPEESRNLLVAALSGLLVFILIFFIFGL
jgi:RsiW-degrading membrane proteinase PrsW (M82 family)